MKILKLEFIYKNHDTLRYGTFLYTKIQRLRKKQDNLPYVFIYKNPDNLRYAIFHGIFKIGGGGKGEFSYAKINALCVTFYMQNKCTLRYVFIYNKCDTSRYIFICKKMHLALNFLSKFYQPFSSFPSGNWSFSMHYHLSPFATSYNYLP